MQIHKDHFGYTIHKIRLPDYKSRFSVWATNNGVIADCVRIDKRHNSYDVSDKIRAKLQAVVTRVTSAKTS